MIPITVEQRDVKCLSAGGLTGNVDSFYELVRPCERQVFAVALCILGNHADAEEIAQEAVLKAFKARLSFRGECKFSTWLIQITINEARTRLRNHRRHHFASLDSGAPNDEGEYIPRDFADWRPIPSQALEHAELREALTRALNSLPIHYRLVVVLRDVDQLSITETAHVLGLSTANVKTRLLRGRLRLRDALASSSYAKNRKVA